MNNNVTRLLKNKNIDFDLIELATHNKLSAVNVASLLHVKPEIVYKTIVLKTKGIPVLAMALETRGFGRKNIPGQLKKMKALKDLSLEIILSFSLFLGIVYYLFL